MKERVVVAMSGGVDSSVAAALLVEAGYEVIGLTMEIWPEEARDDIAHKAGCCSLGAVDDARAVAGALGIPYYVMNLRERFHTEVIDYFTSSYLKGLTPNPCIACNRKVKFDTLLRRARALGASKLATGHYARVMEEGGAYVLRKGLDPRKDQSYVLYNLGQDELRSVLFPCGDYSKDVIREKARALGLVTADKPDSQEICFVTGDYRDLIRDEPEGRPGRFVTTAGEELGPAPGVAHFTVGQRRGIGVPHQEPLYVVALRPETGEVVVGRNEELFTRSFFAEDAAFTSAEPPNAPFPAEVMVRSHARPVPATVTPLSHRRVRVDLDRAERAVTPGQAAVFYDGDRVLGGALIGEVVQRHREAHAATV